MEVLKGEWQLEAADTGRRDRVAILSEIRAPIRPGHINGAFDRQNLYTGKQEKLDLVPIFTSPSIRYGYGVC